MPPRKLPLALVEPDVYLTSWKIFEPDDGLTHLLGSDALRTGGVVSYSSVQTCARPLNIFGLSDAIY